MRFRIARHSNKTLFWGAATTHTVFSLMTDLLVEPPGMACDNTTPNPFGDTSYAKSNDLFEY